MEALPDQLAERSRVLHLRPAVVHGDFVLYWMHHAVRGHENPALDVALTLANRRRLPVLVYQGLGGRHPCNNDRHHTFILQGARDAHRELRELGVTAVFHLDPGGSGPSPLYRLAQRAALVVVEDYPAPPFRNWTRALAAHSPRPVIAVDCACIVPMQLQPQRFERAFQYRRYNQSRHERRVPLAWPRVEPGVPRFDGKPGFTALELDAVDIADLCSQCDIDHETPPVADSPGGLVAGYQRWERFLREGMSRYALERNDAAIPWPRGVSRLSPYLHHGHVSPFRIAREAWQQGNDGAGKFLDELLVWRELAFNFCFFTSDPQRLDALPDWAQHTLHAHASDPRPALLDTETLARSHSGDELWNLAQTSLRIHGELHNNLRMTWAKRIPEWRPTPQAALETLIELNNRYALDGSDPNSYAGLLWALGLFDRPFPERPVTGSLRSRSSTAHAKRLDLARYRMRVSRPASGTPLRIAVIGAGISGLGAARILQDQGHQIVVFEKSRGRGGRAATRRVDRLCFDHGAQYFTARHPVFRRAVKAWREQGLVDSWRVRSGKIVERQIQPAGDTPEYFVSVPGMSALGQHLAADLAVRNEVPVGQPERLAHHWRLSSESGDPLGEFDLLVVSIPAPQASRLLAAAAPGFAAKAAAVEYQPAWAVLLAFETGARLKAGALHFDSGPLDRASDNGSKPGRKSGTWVLHATPEWTQAHLDDDPDQVAMTLARGFCSSTGLDYASIGYKVAHLWRYARVSHPLHTGALWDPELGLGVCGDWCEGDNIEAAFLSGQAVAGRLLGHLANAAACEPACGHESLQPGS